ncbi:hypothetical protein K490DRAFT_64635 [Saccharata proteae CBS 121410]|uniref:Zn(2)-C6 fungal-type domain-containing protein n=1 Tax=Saccharata proteae CBS 121410 TaxID=1314787 RepID=A0A9P4HY27_9PEZI|nr:hypothetical protein K490DRAFT_64635 [Saccharata proteae CBS 121410]
MPRLGHKKSRNGCIQCKKRRVKCDEHRPCNHCARHGVQCSLVHGPPSSAGSRHASEDVVLATAPAKAEYAENAGPDPWTPVSSSTKSRSSEPSIKQEVASATHVTRDQMSIDQNPFDMLSRTIIERDIMSRLVEQVPVTDWLRDLELLHHYSTFTYLTITEMQALRNVYQVVYPRIGYSSKPVMHGILGLSALHLAHLRPEDREKYLVISTNHQNRAISEFRLALPQITQSNCDELYTLSSLTTILRCASMPMASDPYQPSPIDDTMEAFMLMRGVHQVIQSSFHWIASGPLQPMLIPGRFGPQVPFNSPEAIPLDGFGGGLQAQIDALKEVSNDTRFDAAVRQTLLSSVADLTVCFHRIISQPPDREPGLVLIWPIRITPECIFLIRQRHPGALLMLATWCVILHNHGNFWWLGDRAKKVVQAVKEALDPCWHDGMKWPLEYIANDANIGKLGVL